ncbi:MAG: glutaredoxin 3 [Pseudomonadota bacterium]
MAKVTIYTRAFCPFCTRALRMLSGKGADFTEIDAGMDAAKRGEMISKSGGARTYPQIFVGDLHIGGFDDMNALDKRGQLDKLLEAA